MQVLALDDTGGEVLNVTVAGDPKVAVTNRCQWSVWWPSPGPKAIAVVWRFALMPSPVPPPRVVLRVSRHVRQK